MRIIISALLALLIPGAAALSVAQPRQQGKQPQIQQQQKGPQGPVGPIGPQGPQQLRKGMPPAPPVPPKSPPPVTSWLPPFDRGPGDRPWNWLPPPFDRGPADRPWNLPVGPPWLPVPTTSVANLDGVWYMSGDPGKPARIVQWRLDGRALFINEHGSRAVGTVGADSVYIPEWSDGVRQGLVGAIRGDRIVWPDGNFWSRNPIGWFWP